jgi:hypothetical protein
MLIAEGKSPIQGHCVELVQGEDCFISFLTLGAKFDGRLNKRTQCYTPKLYILHKLMCWMQSARVATLNLLSGSGKFLLTRILSTTKLKVHFHLAKTLNLC